MEPKRCMLRGAVGIRSCVIWSDVFCLGMTHSNEIRSGSHQRWTKHPILLTSDWLEDLWLIEGDEGIWTVISFRSQGCSLRAVIICTTSVWSVTRKEDGLWFTDAMVSLFLLLLRTGMCLPKRPGQQHWTQICIAVIPSLFTNKRWWLTVSKGLASRNVDKNCLLQTKRTVIVYATDTER